MRSPSRVQPVTRQARAALRRDKWTVTISDASIVRRQYHSYCRTVTIVVPDRTHDYPFVLAPYSFASPFSFIVVDAWGHSAAEWDAPA